MIQLTPHMRILVATEPVDFRKGIDGLARVCRDPFSGGVTRKMKLLKKQKEGKTRMKAIGNVQIPQKAFMSILDHPD